METKEMRIEVPDGYEIDRENSTFECIKFKPKDLTYEDVAQSLFKDKGGYYTEFNGSITYSKFIDSNMNHPNNAISEKQLEKLLAINKLMNVRKYLCPDYVAQKDEFAYSIYIDAGDNSIKVVLVNYANYIDVFFPNVETAKQAIAILGEDTIRLACSTDW